jgi:predicted TIM-barrel fold metal-dependent hydrolase
MSVYEFPIETTRATMDLLYRGKLAKHPRIRWIISHAGGTIPYLAYRLSTVAEEVKASALSREEVLAALRTLYYDVALSTSPGVLAMLKDLVGASHLAFGTDYPLRREGPTTASIEELTGHTGFSEHELRSIASETARSLFPRFA